MVQMIVSKFSEEDYLKVLTSIRNKLFKASNIAYNWCSYFKHRPIIIQDIF